MKKILMGLLGIGLGIAVAAGCGNNMPQSENGDGSTREYPAHCYNATTDEGETDVDCGGNTGCPRCNTGEACVSDTDCAVFVGKDNNIHQDACQAGRCVTSQQ